jgi:hypothetical protein
MARPSLERDVLQHQALWRRLDRRDRGIAVVEGRQDQGRRQRTHLAKSLKNGDAAQPRHADVEEEHVGFELGTFSSASSPSLASPPPRCRHHFEQAAHALADQSLIIDENDADHAGRITRPAGARRQPGIDREAEPGARLYRQPAAQTFDPLAHADEPRAGREAAGGALPSLRATRRTPPPSVVT